MAVSILNGDLKRTYPESAAIFPAIKQMCIVCDVRDVFHTRELLQILNFPGNGAAPGRNNPKLDSENLREAEKACRGR
jgi:hypothetical protein